MGEEACEESEWAVESFGRLDSKGVQKASADENLDHKDRRTRRR